jgi:hypothetical protein
MKTKHIANSQKSYHNERASLIRKFAQLNPVFSLLKYDLRVNTSYDVTTKSHADNHHQLGQDMLEQTGAQKGGPTYNKVSKIYETSNLENVLSAETLDQLTRAKAYHAALELLTAVAIDHYLTTEDPLWVQQLVNQIENIEQIDDFLTATMALKIIWPIFDAASTQIFANSTFTQSLYDSAMLVWALKDTAKSSIKNDVLANLSLVLWSLKPEHWQIFIKTADQETAAILINLVNHTDDLQFIEQLDKLL